MKIRIGFVSNSSSTSFAIYGTTFEFGDLNDNDIVNLIRNAVEYAEKNRDKVEDKYNLEKLDRNIKDLTSLLDKIEKKEIDFDEVYDNFLESIYCILECFDIDYYIDISCVTYIGRDLKKLRKDQTLGEFGKEVEKQIAELFKVNDKEFEVIVESINC